MLSRRALLAMPAVLPMGRALAQSMGGGLFPTVRNRPKFGAIRWDPWYSMAQLTPQNSVGYQLAVNPGTLAPDAWHFRAPVHAQVGSNSITWAGASQATFDAEIQAANAFGLDYWAFLRYATTDFGSTLNVAFDYYRASTMRTKPRFCLIKQTDNLGTTGNFSTQNADTLAIMQDPAYFFVKGNRPLFYIFFVSTDITNKWGGNLANLKTALDALRASVQAAGLGNPYIVILDDTGTYSNGTGIGADAFSRYVGKIPVGVSSPYATMRSTTEGAWTTDAAGYGKFIPTCNVGFDPTPLNQIPPGFWTNNPNTVVEPTQSELIAHLQAGANFVRANASACEANAVLVYAWSECAEGGVAMMPTIGNPTGTKGQALLSVS